MNLTAKQLASQLKGEVKGNPDIQITHPAKIEQATTGGVAFLANMKYEEHLYNTKASVVIINDKFKPKKEVESTLILVDDAYTSFVTALHYFNQAIFSEQGVHEKAFIHPSATVDDDVYIGPFVSIGKFATIKKGAYIMPNAVIGDYAVVGENTMIYPNVTLYHYCKLGNDCIVHSGTVIGSDGFGFAPNSDGIYTKVPQVGNVEIGNNVEIGSNTSIDRATMGSTLIGNGVKIDNLVQLAHNVIIEDHTVIAAQAGISGSTRIGKHVVVGGQAGFVGHISVADGTKINAKSGISKSITEENLSVSGTPAFDWRDELKSKAVFKRLPDLEKRIIELEKQLNKNKDA